MGCAASVRGDLAKIDGVEEINTDIDGRVCTFKVTDSDVDYLAQLEEFAKTNSKLADFEVQ